MRIPLFPLNTVLFPMQGLPLHVFEERYKLMINRCLDEVLPFGVVLIKSGDEVGGDAKPYDVGTTAEIATVDRMPDGRFNLIAMGRRRFRIVYLEHSEPYLQADVDFLETTGAADEGVHDQADAVAALYAEHMRLLMAISGQWTRELSLPGEPGRLADYVATQIEASNEAKQQLLETLAVPERLERLKFALGEAILALTERWDESRRRRFAGAALN